MVESQLTFQVTWKCDIRCSHCFQLHASPHLKDDSAISFIDELASQKLISRLAFTGGEATIRGESVKKIAAHGKNRWRMKFGMVTNASWATSPRVSVDMIDSMESCGLDQLTISYDHFHAEWVPLDNAINALRAAKSRGIATTIYATFESDVDREKTVALLNEILVSTSTSVQWRRVIPVGAATGCERIPGAIPYHNLARACPSTNTFASVWPDGSLLPCCTAGTHRRLALGNIYTDEHATLIRKLIHQSPASAVRRFGIDALKNGLSRDNVAAVDRSFYTSSCHACHKLLDLHNSESIKFVEESDIASIVLK